MLCMEELSDLFRIALPFGRILRYFCRQSVIDVTFGSHSPVLLPANWHWCYLWVAFSSTPAGKVSLMLPLGRILQYSCRQSVNDVTFGSHSQVLLPAKCQWCYLWIAFSSTPTGKVSMMLPLGRILKYSCRQSVNDATFGSNSPVLFPAKCPYPVHFLLTK